MHNIKDIRNNLDRFKNSLKKRNVKMNIDEIINKDVSLNVFPVSLEIFSIYITPISKQFIFLY